MAFETGHALVVGVGTYSNAPHLNEPITERDALNVAEVLLNEQYCGYPARQVSLLTKQDATCERILGHLDGLAKDAKESDTVFLFYSGHGEYGNDGYYLTTHETRLDEERKVVAGSGIRDRELLEKLNRIRSHRVVLCFNACYSGALTPRKLGAEGNGIGETIPAQLAAALLGTGEGRILITACREDQSSYFGPLDPTTLFAGSLADGLRGKGIESRRGYISSFDLYAYVHATVSATARQRWAMSQEPVLTIHNGIGTMAVALHRGADAQGELETEDRPVALLGEVREVNPNQSQRLLKQVLSGKIVLAPGRDIRDSTIVGGDQRDVTIRRGRYVEGNVDNRKGIFGDASGETVVGYAEKVSAGVGRVPRSTTREVVTLHQVTGELEQAITAAHERGFGDLAADLQRVKIDVGSALGAEVRGDMPRHAKLLTRALGELRDLAKADRTLQTLANRLEQIM